MREDVRPYVLRPKLCLIVLVILTILMIPPVSAQTEDIGCAISSPNEDTRIAAPIMIKGTYTQAYQVTIAFNAGTLYDVHMEDPDGDSTGTWYFSWNPVGYSGKVEITVRCFANSDRYFRWATPVIVNVDFPSQQPPTVTIVSPEEGAIAKDVTPIIVSAVDTQGLDTVQVRIDWGAWLTAIPSGEHYVYDWNTAGLGDKTHAIEARAIDTDGNETKTLTVYVKTGKGTMESPAIRQAARALWVWEPATVQLLEDPASHAILGRLMDDLDLSKQTYKTIYLYADRYDGSYALVENPVAYRSLIRWAHSRGYYVYALLGSSFYVAPMYSYTRYHSKAMELMENVLNYNISSTPEEQFDGINIDIEPHGLPEWLQRPTVQLQYLDMLNEMMQRKIASGQNLNVGPAIPRWLDKNHECTDITWNGATKNCAQHIQDITDYVSVMDYRDQVDGPSGIIEHGIGEIEYADQIGKYVLIGVETDQISATGDPAVITFQEEGGIVMEQLLAMVYKTFSSHPSFLGIAVHHYDSYRDLPTVWNASGMRWSTETWNSSGSWWIPPLADKVAPARPIDFAATPWDWQRIDLHWSRSLDNSLVEYYEVHRSQEKNFVPSAETLARITRFNFVSDWGLLPQTTYYYKIIAVDLAGNRSMASDEVSATTPVGIGLKPMRIESITLKSSMSAGLAKMRIVDAQTGAPIEGASVYGHWEDAAGRKFFLRTDANGMIISISETPKVPWTVKFVPERILAQGYYWAYSQDQLHIAALNYP